MEELLSKCSEGIKRKNSKHGNHHCAMQICFIMMEISIKDLSHASVTI